MDITCASSAETLSGTVVVHARVPPLRRGDHHLDAMAVLSVSDPWKKTVAVHASEDGTASFVLDTAQLENGICEITVSDLRGRSDTRRVRIHNPVGGTGHFFDLSGLPMQSRRAPDIVSPSGETLPHAGGSATLLPAICSEQEPFEIHFSPEAPGIWPVELRDARNHIVRVLPAQTEDLAEEPERRRGQHRWYASVEWDGKDEKGRTMPGGDYQSLVALPGLPGGYQSLGFVHKQGRRDGEDAGAPSDARSLRFIHLAEGERLSGDVLIPIAPASAPGHILLLLDGEPVAAAEAEATPARGDAYRLRQQVMLPLDTIRYGNGSHVLEVRDFHGHRARHTVEFRNPVSEAIYEPDFDTSSPDARAPCSYITATLPAAQPWSIALIDGKGRSVRTFRGTGRTPLVAWDGTDAHKQRAPYGRYEILLQHGTASDTLGYIDLYSSGE